MARAASADFTYTKLLKRLAPGAIAVAACLLLLLLAGLTNQHEWAVGWLRRRYEPLEPLPFTLWMALERGGVLIVLSALAALIKRIRRGASPAELEREKRTPLQNLLSVVPSFIPVQSLMLYAVQIAVLVLLKLLGAGIGTLAAASVFVCAAFVYQKKSGARWMRTLQGAVGSVYIGFAFAHWGMSSWRTALWTTAALYAAPFLTRLAIYTSIAAALQMREIPKVALKHWKWTAGIAVATALWLWFGGSLEWTVGWLDGRYMERSAWSFCWRIAVETNVLSILLLIAISPFKSKLEALLPDAKEKKKEEAKEKDSDFETNPGDIIFTYYMSATVAPVGETIALQALIIVPLSALGADIGTQMVVSALLFALLHWTQSPVNGIAAGVSGGVYFGFAFAFWHTQSIWTALWVTALAHALSNLLTPVAAVPVVIVHGLIKSRRERRKKKKRAENDSAEADET